MHGEHDKASENPYEAPQAAVHAQTRQTRVRPLIGLMFGSVILGVAVLGVVGKIIAPNRGMSLSATIIQSVAIAVIGLWVISSTRRRRNAR